MPISTESPKATSISSAASLSREPAPESFRYYLRQADKLIKEGQFPKAKQLLSEAKKIDPGNPFIFAFEERLRLFEEKEVTDPGKTPSKPGADAEAPAETDGDETAPAGDDKRDELEQKLRHKVEGEYKARYTQELKKAEEQSAALLSEERARFEHLQKLLKAKCEQDLVALQHRLDEEYAAKLKEELARAQERMEEELRSKLAMADVEMKEHLKLSREEGQLQLHDKLKKEQEGVLEQERKSFQEREKKLKEQYDRQLLDALRKSETVLRDQSAQSQEFEKEQLRQKLSVEFQTSLHNEREAIKAEYDAMKQKLEHSFAAQQERLKEELQKQYEERLSSTKKLEAEKFEKEHNVIRRELEAEFQEKLKSQLAAEREKVQREITLAVETEKLRLQGEYADHQAANDEKVRKIRADIQKEMEENLLTRMGQCADEIDYKMELLGAKVPETTEEKHALYRERMRDCYTKGEPTIDEAKRIMELKELLGLSFDEHLAIETDVRLDLYVEYVERKIMLGEINLKEGNALNELKEQFHITPEESARLEPYVLSCLQRVAVKGKVLIADDDLLLLQSLDDVLSGAGYQIVPADGVEAALEYLKSSPVDLILSDIKFSESNLDGFQFYMAVQAQPHLRKIPFVVMSSLRDGVIIRSGVQLGVDDYLTKPVDPDLLLAVIEGKLKRFRNFDRE